MNEITLNWWQSILATIFCIGVISIVVDNLTALGRIARALEEANRLTKEARKP